MPASSSSSAAAAAAAAANAASMWKVVLVAASARVAYLACASCMAWLLPDYDTSAALNQRTCLAAGTGVYQRETSMHAAFASHSAWSWVVWDSVFFSDIACAGYQYEQQYAFFPLLPAMMRVVSSATTLSLPASGLLISFSFSILSTALLLQLSLAVTADTQLSVLATLFYIFSPASIFHTAAYTEALFTTLTFTGLWLLHAWEPALEKQQGAGGGGSRSRTRSSMGSDSSLWHARVCGAALAFMLASCARSNGIINAGFLLHAALDHGLQRLKRMQPAAPVSRAHLGSTEVLALFDVCLGGLTAALTALPLMLHQQHAAATFCGPSTPSNPWVAGLSDWALSSGLWQPATPQLYKHGLPTQMYAEGAGGQVRPWCGQGGVYNFVQKQYWGVGLLSYWRPSQIPNFLLAAPVLLLSAAGCMLYARRRPHHLALGGFSGPLSNVLAAAHPASVQKHEKGRQQDRGPQSGFFMPRVAVFVYPWAFMTACALLVMHVQVATRFLSACPPLYWFMAHVCLHGVTADARPFHTGSSSGSSRWWGGGGSKGNRGRTAAVSMEPSKQHAAAWVWAWCFTYIAAGMLLFPNFYPWT